MRNTREERARFTAAIQKVALVTANREKTPDKATLDLYWSYLKEFTLWQVEQAADDILKLEMELPALPPPGRWRQLCTDIFELHPPKYKSPAAAINCPACDDTGWRPAELVPGQARPVRRPVVRCECKSGGIPPNDIDLSLMLTPLTGELPNLEDEIGPQPGENDLQARRRVWGNQLLHCVCCARPYRRRQGWKCCSAPAGMSSNLWMAEWHIDCEGPGKNRCPNHCSHPKRADRSPLFEEAFEEAR